MRSGAVLELDGSAKRDRPSDGFWAGSQVRGSDRPDMTTLVDAVSRAAASVSDARSRIALLESRQRELEDALQRARNDCSELSQHKQAADAKAALETERAERAEARASWLRTREGTLVSDLEHVRAENGRLAEAILGFLEREDRTRERYADRRSAA